METRIYLTFNFTVCNVIQDFARIRRLLHITDKNDIAANRSIYDVTLFFQNI